MFLLAVLASAHAHAHYLDLDEELVRARTFTMGFALTGTPFAYKEDGQLRGFERAMAQAVADAHGLDLRLVPLPRDRLAAALEAGEVDAINTLALDTEPPATRSVPYLVIGDHVMVLRGNPFRIQRLEDLHGRTVAATAGTTAEVFAHVLNERFREAGEPPMNVHSFPFQRATHFPVSMGHAAAYFMKTVSAVAISQDAHARTRILEGAFRPVREAGFAVRAEHTDVYHAIEHAVAAMVATGKYERLRAAHGLPPELSPYR
ncbi:MAG: transporter substrate-binding domain-containing protein [Gammaproteobacteria bacterium]|nr:transporter substrate-binding domain-containing protein [Gammaproteobacteria bacterium]NIR82966.1 transporter substrate-binding domain-containing protein [Gammaproteobacteria bacterium]NIR90331.1 transporter substrate-binding domain-containing protein [Gammaproteobacteria bacterium]NIU04112.1 transporter substrate-binding domain-containing protein [Gammaproteobacteria bacterium]NIV51408.1 transporter substrate-binding domain-containing protein [Gammaproteobacteria bacterium]